MEELKEQIYVSLSSGGEEVSCLPSRRRKEEQVSRVEVGLLRNILPR